MNAFNNIILRIYKMVILGMMIMILGFLIFLKAHSTCYIDESEITYFVKNNWIINVAALLLVVIILVIMKKNTYFQNIRYRIEHSEGDFQKYRHVLICIFFAVAFIWVISTQYIPGSDQEAIQNAVFNLHHNDYSMFEENGYLVRNPHQLGLVWFYYLFSFIFGSYNFIVLQIINVVCLTIVYYQMSIISSYFGLSRAGQLMVILSGIIFFPPIMYCSFLYGNIPGLCFAMVAVRYEMDFFKKSKPLFAIYSAVAITLAVSLKSNYLIFMVGMLIHAGIEIIRQKKKRITFLILPALIIICCSVQSYGIISLSERKTNTSLEGGSYWAYIAMGLQSSDRAPGWYNGYVKDSYINSGYNKEIQSVMSKAEIQKSLSYFKTHKRDTIQFFMKKTGSQWNNPTFQCYNIIQWRPSNIEKSRWVIHFTNRIGAYMGANYLNLLVFIILVGSLFYCIMNWRSREISMLIFPLIFIGGFIFHLFWEAKGQYTISYFLLLFPVAIAGYGAFINWLIEIRLKGNAMSSKIGKNCWKTVSLGVLFAAVSAILIMFYLKGNAGYLVSDTETYLEYLHEDE